MTSPYNPDPYQQDPYSQPAPVSPGWQQVPPYPQQIVHQVIAAPAPPTSPWSVVSLVFGIISVLGGFCLLGIPCVAAVITGHAGLIDARNGKGGRGLALAGLVMGYLFVIPAVIIIAMGGIGAVLPPTTSP